jgi:uncharacterized RDD family membrane protein YckC
MGLFFMVSDVTSVELSPHYARFSRRLRAMVLDWIVAVVIFFGAVALAVQIESDSVSRAMGISVLIVLVLYEPILISLTGGTLGHYFTNLRVVDDRGGNVSFLKACARFVIKTVLGMYSFVILAATRRNQAVHDVLTRSTVQIRDLAKARPGQYVTERSEILAEAGMPSRLRRVLVTGAYLVVSIFLYLVVVGNLLLYGRFMSAACINRGSCSGAEQIFSLTISLTTGVVLLLMVALVIVQGWRGRLLGARRAQVVPRT